MGGMVINKEDLKFDIQSHTTEDSTFKKLGVDFMLNKNRVIVDKDGIEIWFRRHDAVVRYNDSQSVMVINNNEDVRNMLMTKFKIDMKPKIYQKIKKSLKTVKIHGTTFNTHFLKKHGFNLYKKNIHFLSIFMDETLERFKLVKDPANNYYNFVVIVKDGMPNVLPVPILWELTGNNSESFSNNDKVNKLVKKVGFTEEICTEEYETRFKSYYDSRNVLNAKL